MIDYPSALNKLHEHAKPLNTTALAVQDAFGAVSAATISSPATVPNFANSAMDGFAVHSAATQTASPQTPVTLPVVGSTAAGDPTSETDQAPATAWEIMTGAPMPAGYDAVIRVEDVQITEQQQQPATILITQPVAKNNNLRHPGEDFNPGDPIIADNQIIQAKHIMALAATGVAEIKVRRKPRIAVICTGNEIIDDPKVALQPGQIRNSNAAYLRSILPSLGTDLTHYYAIADQPKELLNTLNTLTQATEPPDVIITTGGVSAGRWDFIPDVLTELSANIVFHKVFIRPGKPILFATLGNTYIIGLPGNPVSAAVGVRFFTYPLLRILQGLPAEKPIPARLITPLEKKPNFRFFYKAVMKINSQGQTEVEILAGQESFKIQPLLKANCWAMLPEGQTTFKAGEIISVYPLRPISGL